MGSTALPALVGMVLPRAAGSPLAGMLEAVPPMRDSIAVAMLRAVPPSLAKFEGAQGSGLPSKVKVTFLISASQLAVRLNVLSPAEEELLKSLTLTGGNSIMRMTSNGSRLQVPPSIFPVNLRLPLVAAWVVPVIVAAVSSRDDTKRGIFIAVILVR